VQIGPTEHGVADIEALIEQHRDGLERYLRFRLRGCPDEAKELAQEAFTRLLELPEGRKVNNWDALLWTIAINLANTRNQQHSDRQAAMPKLQIAFEADETLEHACADEQATGALRRAIAQLPERQRLLLARRGEGQTYETIARELGVTERTCRRDHARAVVAIRTKMGLERK
jgi:RNA polymerase sigma-70 factor (ECF subfamily)